MRLVTAESVLEALGITAQAGSLKVAERALDAITPRFEDFLERKFSEATVVDYFDVLPGAGIKAGSTFRFTFGDVRKVVVRTSPDGVVPADKTFGVIVPSTEYSFDSVGGTLTLLRSPQYGRKALSVSYEVGYEIDPVTQLPEAPAWLTEAARTAAIATVQANPTNVPLHKARFVGEYALTDLKNTYRGLLGRYLRPRAGMLFPVSSETVDA